VPFALLPYGWAAGAWFLFELFCVFVACRVLVKWWSGAANITLAVLLTLALFIWEPVFDEMIFGQLNTLLLVLLLGAWLKLRQDKAVAGGILLGLAIAIKLLVWPIALFLLLSRKWLSVLATGATVVVANLLAGLAMGLGPLWQYYASTSSAVLPFWRAHEANFSLWSLGWRLFAGAHGKGLEMNLIAPLYHSTALAETFAATVPLGFLLFSLWLALRRESFDFAFAIMLCASLLLSPITWNHYLLNCLLPVAIVSHTLAGQQDSFCRHRITSLLALLTTLLLAAPGQKVRGWMHFFETRQTIEASGQILHHIPFAPGLLSLVPLAAVLLLMGLLWRLDGISPEARIPPDAEQIPQHL
jgi:hypothetical protein